MSALTGKTIVITRPLAQATDMVEQLQARGAIPFLFPVIETVMVENLAPLEKALQQIESYDWLVFTSVNAVKFFFMYVTQRASGEQEEPQNRETSKQNKRLPLNLQHVNIAAIGPKTAEALAAQGIQIADIPRDYVQEGFAHFLKRKARPGEKILFPKAVYTRDILTSELVSYGLEIDEVPIYQTQAVQQDTSLLLEKLRDEEIDVLTFTSSSTVQHFMGMFKGEEQKELEHYLERLVLASIGPITTRTARELGLQVDVEAAVYTVAGLIDALDNYYQKE